MNLRANAKDHYLVEDDNGDPVFRFLSIHLSDLDLIIKKVNGQDAEDLLRRLKDAEGRLEEINGIARGY